MYEKQQQKGSKKEATQKQKKRRRKLGKKHNKNFISKNFLLYKSLYTHALSKKKLLLSLVYPQCAKKILVVHVAHPSPTPYPSIYFE